MTVRRTQSAAPPADGPRPGRRRSARAARHVDADARPIRSGVHRLHERDHGADCGRFIRTKNQWSLLVDGTARAGIEAILVSLITPGDKVLVPIFGRFGHLLAEIAQALRRQGRHHRARMGHGVHARRDRGRDQEASAARARGGAWRHLDHDGAAARRDRRDVPQARHHPLQRRHRDARRHAGRRRCMAARCGQRRLAEVPVRPARLGADHLQRALRRRSPSTASISRPASSRRASSTATGRACSRTISISRC